jgi:hypothetical protein
MVTTGWQNVRKSYKTVPMPENISDRPIGWMPIYRYPNGADLPAAIELS